jgi:hypothetical protein
MNDEDGWKEHAEWHYREVPNIFISQGRLVINSTAYPRTYRVLGALWRIMGGYCLHARVGQNYVDFVQFCR